MTTLIEHAGDRLPDFSDDEQALYAAMLDQMQITGYDKRFKSRELIKSEDPYGFLRINKSHIPAAAFEPTRAEIINAIFDARFVNQEDRLRLFAAIKLNIFEAHADYLAAGGNIIIPISHTSYIDGALMAAGQAAADPQTENHHLIMGQEAALFTLDGVGPIADNVLHPLIGVLKTIPAHHAMGISPKTGEKIDLLPQGLRNQIGNRFFSAYQRILQIEEGDPGQVVTVAASAEQNILIPGVGLLMRRADKITTRLFTLPNFDEVPAPTKERPHAKKFVRLSDGELLHRRGSLLTIPAYIGCFPWDEEGKLIGNARINFAFGEPFFAKREGDVHRQAMQEIARLGTEVSSFPVFYSDTNKTLAVTAIKTA